MTSTPVKEIKELASEKTYFIEKKRKMRKLRMEI